MIERIIAQRLIDLSQNYRVLSIIGPRQAGKSTLCREVFKHKPYVNLEDPEQRSLALSDPKGLLARFPDGCFFDEIQNCPELISYIQVIVDQENTPSGKYILSGSHQLLLMDSITQSLAGRTAIVKLLPLAFNELQDYNKALDLNSIIYRGSYPEIVSKNLNPSEAMGFYVQTYLERDVRQIQAIRDLSVFQNFIKLLAGRSGQLLNMSSLSSDLGISEGTIKNWISVAEASFLIYKVPPYYKKLGKRITKTPKIYFYDTSLLCYLLGIRNAEQLATHPARGSIFETYIVSECIKYLWNLGLESNLYFYLDKVLEIDLIAETTKGPIAIEIKSSATFKENLLSRLKQAEPRLKELLLEKFLVLGNEESFSFKNFRIISYRSLGELGELIVS